MKSNIQQVEIFNVVSIKFHNKVLLLQNMFYGYSFDLS
jgi:hypothetical protein